MTIERVQIKHWKKWGYLVKSWSTGHNYFDKPYGDQPPDQAPPIPKTLDELKAQCLWAGVGITIPARITSLCVRQGDEVTLFVRLPDKTMLLDTEQLIKADPKAYPLPTFYDYFWGDEQPYLDRDNVMRFHASRIGDYSIAQCG